MGFPLAEHFTSLPKKRQKEESKYSSILGFRILKKKGFHSSFFESLLKYVSLSLVDAVENHSVLSGIVSIFHLSYKYCL